MTPPQIIQKHTCVCGHPERDHESDHTCYECNQHVDGDGHCERTGCRCDEYVTACQNCGEPRKFGEGGYDVCSRRCLLQIEYAQSLTGAVAA